MEHSYHVSPSSQQLLKGIHVAGLNLLFEGELDEVQDDNFKPVDHV